MDEARMARTESAFREVNEAIAQTAVRFDADDADFVCECSDPECAHRVTAGLEDYERVREDATQFLLAPGHETPAVERVIERAPGFQIVRKFGATVERVVRGLDPRTA
jgi:hypothetical protein